MNGAGGAGRPRALVVEDEEHLARLVADYLARDQIAADIAADGEQALEAARRLPPDVVVLDLMLPGIDGIEVCRRLRTFSDAYVIMLTARAEETDKLIGLAVGADDYMVKPFRSCWLIRSARAPSPVSPVICGFTGHGFESSCGDFPPCG
ncbi:MAG TPA: response regulator [Streptosporangiaceae bacterium]